MTEKRYFKHKPLFNGYGGTFVAFPAKIVVSNTITDKTIKYYKDATVELFEEDENFEECPGIDFFRAYSLVRNHLSNQFYKQF